MLNLKKLIVHELIKNSGVSTTALKFSEKLLVVDTESVELIETLVKSYQSDKIFNAQFDNSEGKYFPSIFKLYNQSSRTNTDFISFTKNAVGNLDTLIRSKILAKGGYLIFAEFITNNSHFIAIFLIRDTEGKILKRTLDSYAIQKIEYLDTSHLAMACRINETKIANDEKNYLSLTNFKQPEISDYFKDWICVDKLESNNEYTKTLYLIINDLDRPINPETNVEYSIDEVRNTVYELAKNNPQKSINLHVLSEQLYNDPMKIINYAEENQISIDTEFKFDKRELKKFIQLNINKDGINLKFSRGDKGTKVRLSEENENMIIIESEKFARAFKQEE